MVWREKGEDADPLMDEKSDEDEAELVSSGDEDQDVEEEGSSNSGEPDQNLRYICAYEWEDECFKCGVYMKMLAFRIELESGEVVCNVIGPSPMRKFAVKHKNINVELGKNAAGADQYLRICNACGSAQGDFFLTKSLRSRDMNWLKQNRILKEVLPKKPKSLFHRIKNAFSSF